jgi:tetracycline 7-halogenase / FADH2 O2-dependent halogenase
MTATVSPPQFDLGIAGSGFGGSLLALIARKLGLSVVLLEKGRHPRFAIGESSTPLANLLLEELARDYGLPRLTPLTSWGNWQKHYPEIGCGLKRGFTFYHHPKWKKFQRDPGRQNQLLVAASPRDEIADTHWYRPEFDHFLVREARAAGVEYLDQVEIGPAQFEDREVRIRGRRLDEPFQFRMRFLIDATGPRGFLHRALGLPEMLFENLPPREALFTHFRGVRRWDELHPEPENPPYPPDDAAVHHVFEDGWIWVLRFNNGITSAGVALKKKAARQLRLEQGASAWARLLGRYPSVQDQFEKAEAILPFFHNPQLSYMSGMIAGKNWVLLPSAAGFVDPLLSTGFPLTLLGIKRLARVLEHEIYSEQFQAGLQDYSMQTTLELTTTAHLVAALFASMDDFPMFSALSLLYFAAASFTETARRLHREDLTGRSFLLAEDPVFGTRFRHCVGQVLRGGTERNELIKRIYETIAPFDVAGLSDRSRRNWHPARAEDLLKAAAKLGTTEMEMRELLVRSGFSVE